MQIAVLLAMEIIVACFILLIVCVAGIANGPVGLVCLYEKDVQERVVQLGLITKAKIKRNEMVASAAMMIPLIVLIPGMVYGINGAATFWEGFWQMSIILWGMGLFDRLFIDWYWVARTKAWLIPGTEDLMPYIPTKTRVTKWITTLAGYPVMAAAIAGLMTLVL